MTHQNMPSAPSAILGPDALRRLCRGVILSEQDRLIQRGAFDPARQEVLLAPDAPFTPETWDDVVIDEATLGFDSLSLLDVVMALNRFFGLHLTGIEDYLLVHRTIGDWVALIGQHLTRIDDNPVLTFATSGSAGPVKEITHRYKDLEAEIIAHCVGPLKGRARPNRIIAAVPPQHIYGFLFTCLLPHRLDLPVVDLHRAAPTTLLRTATDGDLIIGTPLTWARVLACPLQFAPGVSGITSAGPSTSDTWSVTRVRGLARLTEVYGATETAGIATRADGRAPFTVLGHLQRDGDDLVRTDGAKLALQDRLSWVTPDHFTLLGRRDDVVSIAGVNVSLGKVRAVLDDVPGVQTLSVRVMEERVHAFVVPMPDQDEKSLHAALIARARAALHTAARPASITLGAALPRNAMGKLTAWSPPAVTSGQPASAASDAS